MNISHEEMMAFAKWLQKKLGCKKRFVYRNQLTKEGALVTTMFFIRYVTMFFRKLEEFRNERNS